MGLAFPLGRSSADREDKDWPDHHPGAANQLRAGGDVARIADRGRMFLNAVTPIESSESGDDLADRPAVVDLQPLLAGDLKPARVQPELVQDRGVDVGDVVAIFHRVEA